MKKILKNILLILLATITLTSCSDNKIVFEETTTFPNEKWERQDIKKFNININNIDDCYNIYFNMKIDTADIRGYDFPLVVNLYSENGERRMFYSYLKLRTPQGAWIPPLEGSKLVIEQQIKEYFFFNSKGTHRLEVGQGTSRYEIKGVESFSVKIEKAELVYPE